MANQKQIINCVNFNGDDCACGFYRMHFPANCLKTILGGNYKFNFLESENPILDHRFYQHHQPRVIRIQRWFLPGHAQIVKQFLKPMCDQMGIWLVYEIDDVLLFDEIPKYNLARKHFDPAIIGNSIKEIFDACDLITVTTQELKDIYVEHLQQDPNKFFVIPNYLPRWWIGESFNLDIAAAQWKAQHQKPHIGFACSTNHFDVDNANGANINFVDALISAKNPNFIGYAGYNTSANSIGCAISCAIVYYLAKNKNENAFKKLNFIRFLDDYAYQAVIRKEVREKGEISNLFEIEPYIKDFEPYEEKFASYLGYNFKEIKYSLPWNRSFEVEIEVYD